MSSLYNNVFQALLLISLTTSISMLSACGGGGDSEQTVAPITPPVTPPVNPPVNPPVTPPIEPPNPEEKAKVSVSIITELAIEKSNVLAKFKVERTGDSSALAVQYRLGNNDESQVLASTDDFTLVYSDGGDVGASIVLAENQNSRVIELHPTQDNIHEVIEVTTITLLENDNYQITDANSVSLHIADADNSSENSKVFIGYFSAQDGASTTGSGVLSLVLQGDNAQATMSYEFSGLSSQQTDQHIHLAPSGTMIKDIEETGSVSNYLWDLAPGGPFTSKQQMLDNLFSGTFYLNIHTANYPNGEISATFNYDENIAPPEDSLLTADDIERDIVRFLTQATFGATPDDYEHIKSQINADGSNRIQVYESWIEQQMALPTSSMLALTDKTNDFFPDEDGWFARRDAFWPIAVYANDQLRQRIAFALSEILVIGDGTTTIRRAFRGTADYWDTLADNAFSHYNLLLEQVSRHAIMGSWLSHLKNAQADEVLGIYPDENFAREIMQLFSFGLVHQQADGSVKLGDNNLPQATYDNAVIKALARVFTGLSFSKVSNDGSMVDNVKFKLGNKANTDQFRWTEPMKFFVDEHDFAAKTLFNDGNQVVKIAATEASLLNADNELSQVMNAIAAHPTTAPFISYRLIQRLVTSNPSSNYVQRVSLVFGQTGDLTKTIKAILLDPEARNPAVTTSASFGKVKEPILRFSALMRLLNAYSSIDFSADGMDFPEKTSYAAKATLLRLGELPIGQRNLGSASVFNFFSPDFSPSGALASQSLVAPELQLMTESNLVSTMNAFGLFISQGLARPSYRFSEYEKEDLLVKLDKQVLTNIWQQALGADENKAKTVIDYLDFYLNAGKLKLVADNSSYHALIDAMLASPAIHEKIDIAIYGVVNAPESIVQH